MTLVAHAVPAAAVACAAVAPDEVALAHTRGLMVVEQIEAHGVNPFADKQLTARGRAASPGIVVASHPG